MSSSELKLPAPAKINHCLYVTGQYEDGYHQLQTLMQFIDLSDTISFRPRADKFVQVVMNGELQRTNLVLDAAHLLHKLVPHEPGYDICIEKKIPLGAGLGGGSSDAATTLIALDQLWNLGIERTDLAQLSLTLGADVPFFVMGDNALAEGKGEQLTPVFLPDSLFFIVNPDVHVNTGEIFRHSQLTRSTPIKTIRELLAIRMSNDLEPVTRIHTPEVAKALDWLSNFGNARMSGSGASIFLEVTDEDEAVELTRQLPAHWLGFITRGLGQHPLRDWSLK